MSEISAGQLTVSDAELRAREIIERAMRLRSYLDSVVAPDISDEDAKSDDTPALIFPLWNPGEDYVVGDRVRYDDMVYRVVQSHTSQIDWTPDTVPALYTKLRGGQVDPTIEEWEQPTAENPYQKGDRVKHLERFWESLVNGNVWEPTDQTAALNLWKQITL